VVLTQFQRILSIVVLGALLFPYQNCSPMHSMQSTSSLSQQSVAVLAAKFEVTLQPTLLNNCSACHGVFQDPKFAVSDSVTATQTILDNQLANLDNPASSRFVAKILGGHNGFPSSLATEIQTKIEEWATAVNEQPAVDVTAPMVTIQLPMASSVFTGGVVNVDVTASDNVGVTGVRFFRNGVEFGTQDTTAPYASSFDVSTLANGFYNLTVVAQDAAGNSTTSAPVRIEVNKPVVPGGDLVLPTVLITSHVTGATVSGTVNITANASDNVGVVGVQFYVDGAALGTEDTTSPYSATWNTSMLANGTRVLTARARDAAGNMATTSNVSVNVQNAPTNATYTWIVANVLPRCTGCHNSANPMAGYSYSTYAATLNSVTAGNPNASKFYTEINNGSMPRGSTKLTAIQIQAVRDWIAAGALNN
jgi:hypothetical protein